MNQAWAFTTVKKLGHREFKPIFRRRPFRNKLILYLLLSLSCRGNDKMSILNSGFRLSISGMIFVFLFKLFQCMTGVLIRMIFMQGLPAPQLSSTSCFPFLSKVKLHPASTWKYALWLLITWTDLLSYVFQHNQVLSFLFLLYLSHY